MKYCQYPVDPALQNWIRYFWSYDAHTPEIMPLHIRSFADCYPRLIFQDISSFSPVKNGAGHSMPLCYLSGLDTGPSDAFWDSRFSHFGASFFPHALHTFFGINAAELINQVPDICLLDKTEIPHRLLAAQTHHERVAVLSKYFYDKLFKQKGDSVINDLFHQPLIHELHSAPNLAGIAARYRISERQLQRRFKQNVGISASKFNQLSRFVKVLQHISSARYGTLTALAYEQGYADQSHFINDFKQFSGLSPYEFVMKASLGSENASFIYPEHVV